MEQTLTPPSLAVASHRRFDPVLATLCSLLCYHVVCLREAADLPEQPVSDTLSVMAGLWSAALHVIGSAFRVVSL